MTDCVSHYRVQFGIIQQQFYGNSITDNFTNVIFKNYTQNQSEDVTWGTPLITQLVGDFDPAILTFWVMGMPS